MAEEYELSAYPMFNSPTDLGRYLSGIGFDVFNQATNHSLDKGRDKGLLSTLNFWSTVPEATVVGAYKNETDYARIRTLEKNGVTFAFLGMTESTNGIQMPENSEVILMRTQDEEKIRARIEQAKALADVVVVNVHWGVEYTHTPNEMQKSLAKKMVDWGADIILGHHPHVIQPVEYIEREDGTRGVVAYSLGNFISAQDAGPRMLGGALDVEVTKDFSSGKTEIAEVRFLPMITHFERGWANIRIYPYEQYSDELAKTHGVLSGKTPEFSMEYIDGILNEVIGEEFLAK